MTKTPRPEDNDVFRVYIRKNKANSEISKDVYVDVTPKMRLKKFLKIAGKKLGIKASKCFVLTAFGHIEIAFIDELKAEDEALISEGELFFGTSKTLQDRQRTEETMFISVLGSGGVGKSACSLRFVRDCFVKDWDPTIEDAYRKNFEVGGRPCALELLDTAGQDDFESLRYQWMEAKDGYVFVYSVDNRQSLDELDLFFKMHKMINGPNPKSVPIVLVSNKKDVTDLDPSKRSVSSSDGIRKAKEYGAVYIEASAATGENINSVFETLVDEIRQRKSHANEASLSQRCTLL